MIRKIIKKIDNKKVIINIPVIDINDYQAVDNSGVGVELADYMDLLPLIL